MLHLCVLTSTLSATKSLWMTLTLTRVPRPAHWICTRVPNEEIEEYYCDENNKDGAAADAKWKTTNLR